MADPAPRQDGGPDDPLATAVSRLERAVARLEAGGVPRTSPSSPPPMGASLFDAARIAELEADLAAARAREAALREAAVEASLSLTGAADEVRSLLDEGAADDDASADAPDEADVPQEAQR